MTLRGRPLSGQLDLPGGIQVVPNANFEALEVDVECQGRRAPPAEYPRTREQDHRPKRRPVSAMDVERTSRQVDQLVFAERDEILASPRLLQTKFENGFAGARPSRTASPNIDLTTYTFAFGLL